MVFAPVSYVTPVQELSILLRVVTGSRWLAEGKATRRLVAAGLIVVGIVALALG
ncbi:hypothetical protein [Leptolyngbya sp. FACHB-261]|uniref:hypothetical protein n=1 Tax=Leptolyngbya sp. FACHB-261 TaxID=2692806 RepID=UPI00168A0AC4|nr:hypothetical protein [Leptolyngbya sp. FACHB-261]MBD2103015.1 hypothetical protein [Leptolyngbya sp. FACHB-261]